MVDAHLLVEDRRGGARHGRHQPHPVGRAAPPQTGLVLVVLHEGLRRSVVVHDGHVGKLGEYWFESVNL